MGDKQYSSECYSSQMKKYENHSRNNLYSSTDHGDSNDNEDLGSRSTLHQEASTGFEGSDLLFAEGIAAQQKRSALPSKSKLLKPNEENTVPLEALTERIKSLEDQVKVRDTVISIMMKELSGGDMSIDASVGPINSSLHSMDTIESRADHLDSPKLRKVVQVLKENGWDPEMKHLNLLDQTNEVSSSAGQAQNISAMESRLEEKERKIRELTHELSKRADIIEKNREDYSRQCSKQSTEIKNLYIKIEKLNLELHNKNGELKETRELLDKTRNQMEENFRRQFSCINDFLKDQRDKESSSLKSWLDDTVLTYIESHENEIACYKKRIDSLQASIKEYELSDHEMEQELMACRLAHEAHANSYKEHVDSLVKEMDCIKRDYHVQMEKFEAQIQHHLAQEEKLEQRYSAENRAHHDRFSKLMETYKSETAKKNDTINAMNEERAKKDLKIDALRKENENYESTIDFYKKEMDECSKRVGDYQKQLEIKHDSNVNAWKEKVNFYSNECKRLKTEIDSKYVVDINALREEVKFYSNECNKYEQLELDRVKEINSLQEKVNYYSNECDKLKKEIDTLLNSSNCSLEEVKKIVVEHKACKDKINQLNHKADSSEVVIAKINQQLLELEQSHQEDVVKYKNQIIKLKEELQNMSSFEERLMIELSNYVQLRYDFKTLFTATEMDVYTLDNDNSDQQNYLHSSSTDGQNFSLLSKDESENVEACGFNKRKCNMSLQPNEGGDFDRKKQLRDALISELHKEMEVRKLEFGEKNNQLECCIKANNYWSEHCKSLEEKFVELQNFAAEKTDELDELRNSNEVLSSAKEQLEYEKQVLQSKLDSLNSELSSQKAELENISYLFDCNSDDSGARTQSFQMKRLFKNVPSSTPNVATDRFGKSKSNCQAKVYDVIVEQFSHFSEIERENGELKQQIDRMTSEIRKNDYVSQVVENELESFQEKTRDLEKRLVQLESDKKNSFKLELINEQLKCKNQQLLEYQDTLQGRIAHLEETNNTLERKCNEMKIKFTLDFAHNDINDVGNEALEHLILEFSKKAEEALSLKEEMTVKQESINRLEHELDQSREAKNEMKINIDMLTSELKETEEKLKLLKQNRMDIGLEKRMLEQKLVSMKVKYDQLLNESGRKDDSIRQYHDISVHCDVEKEPSERDLSASGSKNESMNSVDWFDKGNVESIMTSFINLEQEKEFLKDKIKMFEQLLHKILDNDGDQQENDKMKNSLKEMYEQLEENYNNFSMKAINMKETRIEELVNHLECLEKKLKDDCSALTSEKEDLQKHLFNLQNKLFIIEENFKRFKVDSEKELLEKDMKIRQAELNLRALKMDNVAHSYGLASCKSDSRTDLAKQYQNEIEKIHELTVSKLKSVYLNQIEEIEEKAENKIRSMEEGYRSQIEVLHQDLKEKAEQLYEIKIEGLGNRFNSSVDEDLKTLAERKVELENNLTAIEKKLSSDGLLKFHSFKLNFEAYLKLNNAYLKNSLKNEYCSNVEEMKSILKEEYERERMTLKSRIEAEFSEQFRTKVQTIEKKLKNDLNAFQWIVGYEENGRTVESRSSELLHRLQRVIIWEYRHKLESLAETWNSKYNECLSNVNKRLSELEIKTPTCKLNFERVDLENSEESEFQKVLSFKEKLVETSEGFYEFLIECHKTSLVNILTNVKDVHIEVSSKINDFQLEIDNACTIASLRERIENLEKEKEELDHQLESAMLSKDQETESEKVAKLLKQSGILGDYVESPTLIDVETKIEERLKQKYEEQFVKQRKYFENLVAELGKNYSDGIMIQHSSRLSGCSSNSGSDSNFELNPFGSCNPSSEEKGYKTEANMSLKTMILDEKHMGEYSVGIMCNQSNENLSKNDRNVERRDSKLNDDESLESNMNLPCHTKILEVSIASAESTGKCGVLPLRDEFLELSRDDSNDVIEEFGLMWKGSDTDLPEKVGEKSDASKFGFDSKLVDLENEKRELERVIETLSKQNSSNDDVIFNLKKQVEECKRRACNKLCENCKSKNIIERNQSFGSMNDNNMKLTESDHTHKSHIEGIAEDEDGFAGASQFVVEGSSEIEEKYQYLFESLQKRIELLSENLNLEASVRAIVYNVKISYESDIQQMQFQYDKSYQKLIENRKNEELIRKFDKCLEKINSQHNFEKDQLKHQMTMLVQDYEEKLRDQNEHIVRLVNSQRNMEEKYNEEKKITELQFQDDLVEILSDYISKFALQRSITGNSDENFESELKQKTNVIAKFVKDEYERRLEEERSIMMKEFCELQRSSKAMLFDENEVSSESRGLSNVETIEKQISEKYDQHLALLIEKHNVELANIKSEYEYKLQEFREKFECDSAMISNECSCVLTDNLTIEALTKERDDLNKVGVDLRKAIVEIGNYLLNCEDELNKTVIRRIIENNSDGDTDKNNHKRKESASEAEDSDSTLTGEHSKHVHFAPDMSTILESDCLIDCVGKGHDISIEIRNELESCMKRLKSEAAAVLDLTSSRSAQGQMRSVESRRLASVTRQLIDKNKELKDLKLQLEEAKAIIAKYEQELFDVHADLDKEKKQREKDRANCSFESIHIDKEQAGVEIDVHFQNLSQLQERARTMVSESENAGLPLHVVSIVEEMCQHVDQILEEARKEREDLQSQIETADKQLRNTRTFLDDQATEREYERDEFIREITALKQQLQDKERDWMSKERFVSERSAFENGSSLSRKVENLEQKVQETTNLLIETEERKDEIDRELKEADQKVLVLKEIIRDLECQDRTKTLIQTSLEQRLVELEKEFESQKNDQNAMVLELEAMQDGSPRDINLKQLEEHFKKQFNPSLVEQMKSQLREMARSIQKQTKYMEGLNVHISSASLSSPSEDISIREQLDLFKCQTPEGCRSPLLSLPTEEISLLQDQLLRHTKIEEITIKRIRDQEMQLNSLQSRYEDVLAERDVLQKESEKQLTTLASTKTRLDEVRLQARLEQTKCDAINVEKINSLEDELHSLQTTVESKEREVNAHQQQIAKLQKIVAEKESELCNYVDSQNKQIELLQQKLKVMESEKGKMKVMLTKLKEGHNMSLSALMEELLAEKNADIDHLEQMVKELRERNLNTSFVESQSSSRKSNHSNSKGHRVSFADEAEVSHGNDDERTRDAANFTNAFQNFSPHFSSTVQRLEKSEEHVMSPQLLNPVSSCSDDDMKAGGDYAQKWPKPNSPKYDVIQMEELKIELDAFKTELHWKSKLIEQYEEKLKGIPYLESELKRARDDLAATISEISEDKKYYQDQLELMSTLRQQLNERDDEVQELKDAIAFREENLVRVTADLRSMQIILEKSQKKIEDAKKAAVSDDTKRLSKEVESLKDENLCHVQEILALKKELDKVSVVEVTLLKENLSDEQKVSEKLRNEIDKILEEKKAIALELETSKNNYLTLKRELETTIMKLLDCEKEIIDLRKDLESSTELNVSLNKKFHEANHELNMMSRKMSSEISNRVKKDSDDLIRMKDELERLRSVNYQLELDCEKLKAELSNRIGETTAMLKVTEDNSKIEDLKVEIDKLREEREMMMQSICGLKEKVDSEKSRCETLCSAADAYRNSETLAQEKLLKEKEMRTSAEKKSQFLKREYEKLKRAKKELEKKGTVLKDELEKEKRHTLTLENGSFNTRRSLAELQVTPVDIIEIIPNENRISGSLDDLTGQLQNELDTSARLDDTLLSTLDLQTNNSVEPSESLVAILHKLIEQGFKNLTPDETDHLFEELSLHAHRPPRIAELMERISKLQLEIKKQLKSTETLRNEIEIGNANLSKEKDRILCLETEIDRLQKIISYQEERLATLSSTVEQNKTQMSDLKLSLLKEKGNFKKLHVLFEGERDKIKQIQKEDTELIEDLRLCLENEKDSKVRLQICLEQERERLQTLEAQLNALQAIEQFAPRSSNEVDHVNKCLDEWKEKYTDIGVKLEKEIRHVSSLSAALNKEKEECNHLRAELYKKGVECIDLHAEVEELKCEVDKERLMNKEINDKLKTIQEAEMRRQRNRAVAEEKHKKALERAKIQKLAKYIEWKQRELEVEVARLRSQLIAIKGDESISVWSDEADSAPLVNQIKDVNSELEQLGREKKQLNTTVRALLEENEHLEFLISQSAGKQIPQSEASYFISLYIRSKSQNKALIWQKRYLMLSLQGYQVEGERLAMKISSSIGARKSWVPQLSVTSKPNFKHAALAVIAVTRMRKIMYCRKEVLGVHYKTASPMKEHLIRRKLKVTNTRNEQKLSPVSSPAREIETSSSPFRSQLDTKGEGLLKPTRLADYLETFNELQTRLSQALSSPERINIGLESKISSKVSN